MLTMRWICINCDKIMDLTNFIEFIKESDNDKNSNQQAVSRVPQLASTARVDL